MSLIGALNIGKAALAVTQAQIQTTGNNISNAGNADYTRQVARATPNKDQQVAPGIFLGSGINLQSVQRQIDEALEGRIRGSVSEDESAGVMQQWLGRIESLFNELTDQDLSTQLSTFFNSWSNLANKPQDIGLRQVVIQNGSNLAQSFKDLRAQLGSLQGDVDQRTEALVNNANALADQIAQLNAQIIQAEAGSGGTANALRDQRDAVLRQLAELIDIKTVLQDNGVMDVYVGSEPLVTGDINRGVGMRRQSVDGTLETAVIFRQSDGAMKLSAGQLGALAQVRSTIGDVVDKVDSLAASLIFELNRIHSSGQGLEGMTTAVADNIVADTTATLNSQGAGLRFTANTGSFVVHVRNRITGLTSSTLIQVDLDGLNGDDTTLQSLQADLDAVGNISASISGGRLSISADSPDVEISFSQDSSGVLAALGINSFFSGADASDIAVNQTIASRPALLAAAQNGERGDNQTALAIAGLESQGLASLGGASIRQSY
ncbi:MAG TPA: flagellar hook-associated protein FlgK, partial [Tepidisphaeraceae bacterium]|nr:flagellar hook-associated protein FlgK [Tepidisphaeraceae bacterium]